MQDGFTVCFQSPSAFVSFGESVSVCDTTESNQAIGSSSSLKSYKFLGEKLGPFIKFIELFKLEEELSRKASVIQSSLEHGLKILKELRGGLDERHRKQTIFLYRMKVSTRS